MMLRAWFCLMETLRILHLSDLFHLTIQGTSTIHQTHYSQNIAMIGFTLAFVLCKVAAVVMSEMLLSGCRLWVHSGGCVECIN